MDKDTIEVLGLQLEGVKYTAFLSVIFSLKVKVNAKKIRTIFWQKKKATT